MIAYSPLISTLAHLLFCARARDDKFLVVDIFYK
jgi:hypothetical protein